MQLPVELAQWQPGYVALFIIAAHMLFITMEHIIISRDVRYAPNIGLGIILVCVGLASTLFDFSVITAGFEEYGKCLLAESMAMLFIVMMFVWAICIIWGALFFALRLHVIKKWRSVAEFCQISILTLTVMIMVVKFTNHDIDYERTQLLQELIFVIIPSMTCLSIIFGRITRRVLL